MKISLNRIQLKMIYKLSNKNRWGAGHMLDKDLCKGFPSGIGDLIDQSIDKLIKSRILLESKKGRETHYCLNKELMKLILRIIDWYNDNLEFLKNKSWNESIDLDLED